MAARTTAVKTRFSTQGACLGSKAHGQDVHGKGKNAPRSTWIVDRLKGSVCCAQCTYRGVQGIPGKRCQRITCVVGPYCWQHTAKVYGVRIQPSTIPEAGKGLFAIRRFERGALIAPYKGEVYKNRRELEQATGTNTAEARDLTAEYVIGTENDKFINAYATNSSPARYANHKEGHDRGHLANAKFWEDGSNHEVWLRATRPIAAGSEIFVDYGRDYWNELQNTEEHETKDILPAIAAWYRMRRAEGRLEAKATRSVRRAGFQTLKGLRRSRVRSVMKALWKLGLWPMDLTLTRFFVIPSGVKLNRQIQAKAIRLVSHIVEI